jgi:lipid-binding SYLF domain-containing protein
MYGSTDTEMEWSEVKTRQLKLASAAIGASAVVAMGALTAVLSDDNSSNTVVSGPEITLGETTTIEKAASTPETTIAAPEVTAEVPCGFDEGC